MVASLRDAVPHVLAAITWSALETCRSKSSSANIRNATTPKQIRTMAESAGWKIMEEHFVVPHAAQRDGYQEVTMLRKKRVDDALEAVDGDAKKSMLQGLRDTVEMAVNRLDGGENKVRNMDVWVATFSKLEVV